MKKVFISDGLKEEKKEKKHHKVDNDRRPQNTREAKLPARVQSCLSVVNSRFLVIHSHSNKYIYICNNGMSDKRNVIMMKSICVCACVVCLPSFSLSYDHSVSISHVIHPSDLITDGRGLATYIIRVTD